MQLYAQWVHVYRFRLPSWVDSAYVVLEVVFVLLRAHAWPHSSEWEAQLAANAGSFLFRVCYHALALALRGRYSRASISDRLCLRSAAFERDGVALSFGTFRLHCPMDLFQVASSDVLRHRGV